MVWNILEFVAGVILVCGTLIDLFGTVVVPGRVRLGLRLPSMLRRVVMPVWRKAEHHFSKNGGSVGSAFAAFLLLLLFLTWILLLLLGLSLMMHALRAEFSPRLPSFAEALYQTGSSMMTLGIIAYGVHGWARIIPVLAGLCGLQVVTLTLTYIVQLQMALQTRDPHVLKLLSRAGRPPSGLQLLVTYKELRLEEKIPDVFVIWEEWSATLKQTHKAHPILAYFRTAEPGVDWVTAIGALLDASILWIAAVRTDRDGDAKLFFRTAADTVRELCANLGLTPGDFVPVSHHLIERGLHRLGDAGFQVCEADEVSLEVDHLRGIYAGGLKALADHFEVDMPEFLGNPASEPFAKDTPPS